MSIAALAPGTVSPWPKAILRMSPMKSGASCMEICSACCDAFASRSARACTRSATALDSASLASPIFSRLIGRPFGSSGSRKWVLSHWMASNRRPSFRATRAASMAPPTSSAAVTVLSLLRRRTPAITLPPGVPSPPARKSSTIRVIMARAFSAALIRPEEETGTPNGVTSPGSPVR